MRNFATDSARNTTRSPAIQRAGYFSEARLYPYSRLRRFVTDRVSLLKSIQFLYCRRARGIAHRCCSRSESLSLGSTRSTRSARKSPRTSRRVARHRTRFGTRYAHHRARVQAFGQQGPRSANRVRRISRRSARGDLGQPPARRRRDRLRRR